MSNSTTLLDTISAGQSGKEITANDLFDAGSPATLFGRRASTTSGLTWGYYGGTASVSGVLEQLANGTITLSNNADNYIEFDEADTDFVVKNTSGWTSGLTALYKVTTSAGAVTSYEDWRTGTQAAALPAGAGDVVGPGSATNNHIPQFDGTTGKLLKDGLALDTDTTLAANSDTRVPSQKAVKTAIDNAVTGLWDVKGATDCSANPNYPAASKGDAYVVSVAGKIGGASGTSVDVGDVYVALLDNAGGTEASVGTSWFHIEHNLAGVYVSGGTDVAVADGGTGSSTASGARTNLGLVIGTDVQAHDADLDTIAGLTATTDSFLQSKSSAWASRTVAQVTTDLQSDGLTSAVVGFRNIPQNSQSAAYTTVAADSGKHILHPSGDANARTFTIDSNANVAYPVGTAITFINQTSQVVTIAITSDTLTLANSTTSGSRSLAQNGVATAIKITSTIWIISGSGLT